MTPYDLIEGETAPHTTGTRTRSVGLLAWFLEAVWRLEPEEVPDLICDGGGDRGIDAIFVDEDIREISVFQSKHRDTATATQGDADLRAFIGVAPYFETLDGFDQLMASRMSPTLRHLLERLDIRSRLEESDYSVRLVFLTNAPLDQAGLDYAAATVGRTPSLDIWDRDRLAAVAARTRRAEMRGERVELSVPDRPTNLELGGDVTIAVGLVPAQELAQLPGIDDLTLFARNVRLGLGRSRVNRELDATLQDAAEHAYFPAYHNGLTLLTRAMEVGDRSLSLDGVTVVNGCQSLIALRARQAELTPTMYVLAKVVVVPEHSNLADRITYRSNNQNSVDIRDQRSTDPIQRALQADTHEHFGEAFGYQIREGETVPASVVIDNKTAAQFLMAIYLRQPWNAVRKVRLFDEDYHRIFNKDVDGHKLFLVHLISEAIAAERGSLRPDLLASYAAVRLTIGYLVGQVLRQSELGTLLINEPQRWLPHQEPEVMEALRQIAADVINSMNYYVEGRLDELGEQFDVKTVFKSAAGVRPMEADVINATRRQARRDTTYLFNIPPSG